MQLQISLYHLVGRVFEGCDAQSLQFVWGQEMMRRGDINMVSMGISWFQGVSDNWGEVPSLLASFKNISSLDFNII